MKSANGFIELVILMAFLVGAVPLIVALVNVASFNEYEYLDDKSVVSMSGDIDYREIDANNDGKIDYLVPEKYGSFTIDPSAAVLLTVINDDFCPEDGRNISYRFNGTGHEGFGLLNSSYQKHNLNIVDGWVSKRFTALSQIRNSVQPYADDYYNYGDKLYLAWDPATDNWVIQDNYVYIWEMK